MIYIVRINDKEYEVEVERGKATLVKTGTVAPSAAAPAAPQPAAPAAAAPAVDVAAPAAGEKVVAAPMPGTILDIKVAPGQSVKRGELLLVLEAMKMENEIFAPADGVVAQVLAAKGASVSTGDPLISFQ